MDFRKFSLIITVALSVFLFFAGSFLLVYSRHSVNNGTDSQSTISRLLDPIKPAADSVNILVLGGDNVGANTDTMMLVNFNPSTAGMNILSIPRDTKVSIKGSSVPKVNSAYSAGGEKEALDIVSQLLKVRINYYVYLDTTAFRKIIDVLDGMDYDVPVDMNYDDPLQNLHIHLKKGPQHMNGEQAERFMRFRQPSSYNNEIMQFYDGSDLKRIDAQQNFIRELIRQKSNIKYISRANTIINIVFKSIKTDISSDQALKLLANINKLNAAEINMMKLPGTDSNEESGWYFIMNRSEADSIISRYFVSASGRNKKEDSKPSSNTQQKPTATPAPGNRDGESSKPVSNVPENGNVNEGANPAETMARPAGTPESFSRDNPSNSDTSMRTASDSVP